MFWDVVATHLLVAAAAFACGWAAQHVGRLSVEGPTPPASIRDQQAADTVGAEAGHPPVRPGPDVDLRAPFDWAADPDLAEALR